MTAPTLTLVEPRASTRAADISKYTARFWDRYCTDDLISVRDRMDSVLDARARQIDLFEPALPAAAPEPLAVPASASPALNMDLAQILSPSQLNCFMECQAKWWYRHALKLAETRGSGLMIGSAVHDATGANFRQKIDTHVDLPLAEVLAAFDESFGRQLCEGVLAEGETADDLYQLGHGLVAVYMSDVAPFIQPAAVEVRIEGQIGGVAVQGYIDVLDVDGMVIDLKTAKKKPSGVRPDYRRQVTTYSLLCPQASGRARLDTLTKTKTINVVPQTFDVIDSDKREVERLYPLAQEAMRSGLYLPNRGSFLCSRDYCSHCDRCVADYGGEVE